MMMKWTNWSVAGKKGTKRKQIRTDEAFFCFDKGTICTVESGVVYRLLRSWWREGSLRCPRCTSTWATCVTWLRRTSRRPRFQRRLVSSRALLNHKRYICYFVRAYQGHEHTERWSCGERMSIPIWAWAWVLVLLTLVLAKTHPVCQFQGEESIFCCSLLLSLCHSLCGKRPFLWHFLRKREKRTHKMRLARTGLCQWEHARVSPAGLSVQSWWFILVRNKKLFCVNTYWIVHEAAGLFQWSFDTQKTRNFNRCTNYEETNI